ncbi:MAG: NYN domain-containing protein [Actinobacteria bacterium]|nr:NYN domain-containing protein [Actinomycetota bacterium]
MEKVAVFVDGANLYHSIKSYYKGVLDYGVLLDAAVGNRKLLRATFYIVEKQEADENSGGSSGARSFVYNLNKFGYKVRSKPLVVHESLSPEGEKTVSHKGDWDMGIVVDMMSQALLDVCDLHTDLGDIPDLFRYSRSVSQQQVG